MNPSAKLGMASIAKALVFEIRSKKLSLRCAVSTPSGIATIRPISCA